LRLDSIMAVVGSIIALAVYRFTLGLTTAV
jgi:hypothetical protein